jgi:hypothetical protein
VKEVQGLHETIQGNYLVHHSPRNDVHVPRPQQLLQIPNNETSLFFQDHPHLLMRMRMGFHNRPRLEFHEVPQHVLSGGGENVNTRKDGMLAAL